MIPFSTSAINTQWWQQWSKEHGKPSIKRHTGLLGSLKMLTPYIGKEHAAAFVQMGFVFNEHYEIPGVGLVQLDQDRDEKLFLGQASVLHWVALNDPTINAHLRSLGILQWWT